MIAKLIDKCERKLGGYSCDKQSAYQNGFEEGLDVGIKHCIEVLLDSDKNDHPSDIAAKLKKYFRT